MDTSVRPIENNSITLLLLWHRGVTPEPPEGFEFIADENNKLLRDERGAYLLEISKEE